jgi:enamine deaminase RidA (YjgF/YER057c/UK114 family)
MAVHLTDVPGLSEPPGYSHLAVGTGRSVVATAGQVPLDAHGNLVGPDDHRAQAEQVLRNLLLTLETAGATPAEVLKTTVYVAGGDHDAQGAVWNVVRGSAIGRAPSTLLGVERLGYRGQLVEIEALAIIE